MGQEPLNDDQTQYDIFQEDSSLESLDVAEERSLTGGPATPHNMDRPKRKVNHSKLKKRLVFGLAAVLLLVAAGYGLSVLNKPDKPTPTTVVINTQSLDNGTLNQVTPKNDSQTKQQLTISPDTIFKNSVTVQGSAEIVKNLTVGGKVSIQSTADVKDSLTVGKSLSVGSNLTVNGLITAASLSVGSLTISSINLSSNLVFGGHIVPFGSEPTVRPSVSAAGGTVTISGNDTSGTVTINTGNGNITPGELVIITFRTPFSATPKVQLTPLNSGASGLRFFATHTASFFTVNTSTAPVANTTYIFDYLVTQ